MYPDQHRETARVLLYRMSPEPAIFLLLTHFDPEVGLPPRWITPGGGIDPGESTVEAAIRELAEETGLKMPQEALGEKIWETDGRWDWSDGINHHTFVDHFYALQVDGFELDTTRWTDDERRDIVEFRWWSVAELKDSGERISPPGLVEFVAQHLQG